MSQNAYHEWYYKSKVWKTTTFLGVPCQKSVSDMWSYQEILASIQPALIVEFGVYNGGSSLYLASIARLIKPSARVLSVDIDLSRVDERARLNDAITFIESSSTDPAVESQIVRLREIIPGPVFFIIDSDHSKEHVLSELELVRRVTKEGDYVVVEDGNINGHPILPGWGEGPYEAIEAYVAKYPDDYTNDVARETKFGFTFAPRGFLIRR